VSDQMTVAQWEREQWLADHSLKEREVAVKEREQETKAAELSRARWSNPLALAVLN
jgi:hypothetical protein